MSLIEIKDFKGLYTNADSNDINFDYAQEFAGFKPENGYIINDSHELISKFALSENERVELLESVLLTSDILNQNYSYYSEEFYLLITLKGTIRTIYLYNKNSIIIKQFTETGIPSNEFGKVQITNINGEVRVYGYSNSYIIKHLNRTQYIWTNNERKSSLRGSQTFYSGIIAEPILPSYSLEAKLESSVWVSIGDYLMLPSQSNISSETHFSPEPKMLKFAQTVDNETTSYIANVTKIEYDSVDQLYRYWFTMADNETILPDGTYEVSRFSSINTESLNYPYVKFDVFQDNTPLTAEDKYVFTLVDNDVEHKPADEPTNVNRFTHFAVFSLKRKGADSEAEAFVENFLKGFQYGGSNLFGFPKLVTNGVVQEAICIPRAFWDVIKPVVKPTINYGNPSPILTIAGEVDIATPYKNTYTIVGIDDFLNISESTPREYLYTSEATTGDNPTGFMLSATYIDALVTFTFDENAEIITQYERLITDKIMESIYFQVSANLYYPTSNGIINFTKIDPRLTKVKIYLKTVNDTDFKEYVVWNLLEQKFSYNPNINFRYLNKNSSSGVYLLQNIGYLFNVDYPNRYKYFNKFTNICTNQGLTLATIKEDPYNVYYSIVGAGVMQSDVVYQSNVLFTGFKDVVTAIEKMGNNYFVCSDRDSVIYNPSMQSNSLIFTFIDALEFGVKGIRDIVNLGSGLIMNSRLGIYLTDGYKRELLSEPINDLVRNIHSNSKLLYDKSNGLLYVVEEYTLYVFDFEKKKWYSYNDAVRDRDVKDIFFCDELFYSVYDANTSFYYLYNRYAGKQQGAFIKYWDKHLRIPNKKIINYVDIDYCGSVTLTLTLDSKDVLLSGQNSSRSVKRFYIPLENRIPFDVFCFHLYAQENTNIYNINIDYEVLGDLNE